MYKELVIAIIIVIVLITIDVNLQKYTDTAVNSTIEQLSNLKEKLNQEENQTLIKKSDEIYENWMNYYTKLAYFIEHDELEKVESDFTLAKSYIKTNQYNFATAKIEETIFILQHINDKYALNLENIF